MILTADDLRPGVRFKYNGHPVEILRGLEKRRIQDIAARRSRSAARSSLALSAPLTFAFMA